MWNDHVVGQLDSGQYQLFIALHLIHEVTSPQAFGMLKDKGLSVRYPSRTFATVDHIIPTDNQSRPLQDDMAEKMIQVLSDATKEAGIEFFPPQSGNGGRLSITTLMRIDTLNEFTLCPQNDILHCLLRRLINDSN
ncbi:aconitase family protein [Pseudomonadales bacterium]|nr:aconitase family protein [Pseudomonadales bacterium]